MCHTRPQIKKAATPLHLERRPGQVRSQARYGGQEGGVAAGVE